MWIYTKSDSVHVYIGTNTQTYFDSLVSGGDGDPYRWQRRGGFTFSDDAGVAFRRREHSIMRALVTGNIYDLNAGEKLKILKTLCAQLLTYATTRDIIDDGFDR